MMLNGSLIDLGAPLAPGVMCVVADARGLVVFVHGDGPGDTARRSEGMALRMQSRAMSTLVLDLLTPQEAARPETHDDVELLARRLTQALDALPAPLRDLPVGLLGTGVGAAAALVVAAQRPQSVRAVVTRSGRPDLAQSVLGDVRAPTLLLVGAADPEILELNRAAYGRLRGEKRIDIVPRATHLFLEAGTLDVVALRAGDWFAAHLPRAAAP